MITRLVLTLLLCSCATITVHDALLSDLPLLPATAQVPAPEAMYAVRATQRGVHHDVIVVLSRQGDAFTLRALSEIGLTLFQWPAAANDAAMAPHAPAGVDPEVVVRLLQLSLWPLAQWQQALTGSLWRVTESDAGTRELSRGARDFAVMVRGASDAVVLRACLNDAVANCARDSLLEFVVSPLAGDVVTAPTDDTTMLVR